MVSRMEGIHEIASGRRTNPTGPEIRSEEVPVRYRGHGEGEDGYDVIGRTDEDLGGRPLLMPVMRSEKRLPAGQVALEAVRGICPAGAPARLNAKQFKPNLHALRGER